MVQISQESPEETEQRLLRVIAEADFKVYDGTFTFEEFPLTDFAFRAKADAFALVRDAEIWSQLVPSKDASRELFSLFSFHFDGCSDNSGFVGWLANHLKQKLGTGVFVTCGQNSKRGGIFDYWGVPAKLGTQAIQEIQALIQDGMLAISQK
ncbi:MAG: DUF6196 family protein [Cyanobacteria bacterium P01_G01_bin.38]